MKDFQQLKTDSCFYLRMAQELNGHFTFLICVILSKYKHKTDI